MKVVIFAQQNEYENLDLSSVDSLKRVAKDKQYQVVKILQPDARQSGEVHRCFQLLNGLARAGIIQKIVVPRLAHLGISPSIVLERISHFKEERVSVYIASLDMETLSPYKVWNESFIPIITVLEGFSNYHSSSFLSASLPSTPSPTNLQDLQRSEMELMDRYPKIVTALKRGRSVKNTALIYGASESLVRNLQKAVKSSKKNNQLSLAF